MPWPLSIDYYPDPNGTETFGGIYPARLSPFSSPIFFLSFFFAGILLRSDPALGVTGGRRVRRPNSRDLPGAAYPVSSPLLSCGRPSLALPPPIKTPAPSSLQSKQGVPEAPRSEEIRFLLVYL
ncbi:hypothetical protein VPH35_062467 [Triticum aestivum]